MSESTDILEDEIRLKKELLTALYRISNINYRNQDNTELAVKTAQKVLKDNDMGYYYE